MSILYNAFSKFNIFFKWMFGTIDHNRGKTSVYACFADFKIFTMVKMQANGQTSIFDSGFNQFHKINVVSIFAGTGRNL